MNEYSYDVPILEDYRPYTRERHPTSRYVQRPHGMCRNFVIKENHSVDSSIDLLRNDSQSLLWEMFYRTRRTKTGIYPCRHYLITEFPELLLPQCKSLLEVGCGNGSTIIPLVQEIITNKVEGNPTKNPLHLKRLAGTDISWTSLLMCLHSTESLLATDQKNGYEIIKDGNSSIKITSKHVSIDLVCDSIADANSVLHPSLQEKFDAVSITFVMSALPPAFIFTAFENIVAMINPGGYIYFRDYCNTDSIKNHHSPIEVDECHGVICYTRKNGTLISLFEEQCLADLFSSVGLSILRSKVVEKKFSNTRNGDEWKRYFVQYVLQKT